ncbi:MAG: aldo/keto reductase [Acidobacteria bacterium]|nr:aldo/keto reductase [Acidobacteriota bacterium]
MRYRNLGRTGAVVSEIGFGAWGIGKQIWGGTDDAESKRALHRALDLGINFIDTALVYGNGHSERLIGSCLQERSEKVFVATKIPPANMAWPARGSVQEAFPANHIQASVESSLRNLRRECLDLIQLHVWHPSWLAETEWSEELSALRRQGKVAHVGVSINDHQPASALELVRSRKIETIQVIYNIFDQSPEDHLFPLCNEYGIGVIARVPFDEGALTGTITEETTFHRRDWRNQYFRGGRKKEVVQRISRLQPFLEAEKCTLPELALRFCLHHPAVSTVIPGMRQAKHVEMNVAVSGQPPLSSWALQHLREHRWPKNFYE